MIMMAKEKIEIGDIRPIFQQVGWEVCEITEEDKEKWIPCEKECEAKILSLLIKQQNKK